MALNNKPIQRSPGERQERFPYIDRVIRLFLIVEGRGKGTNPVQDQDQVIINRVLGQMTNAVTARVTRSNGESPGRGKPTRQAAERGHGGPSARAGGRGG